MIVIFEIYAIIAGRRYSCNAKDVRHLLLVLDGRLRGPCTVLPSSEIVVRLELIPRFIQIRKHRRTDHLLLRGRALRDLHQVLLAIIRIITIILSSLSSSSNIPYQDAPSR